MLRLTGTLRALTAVAACYITSAPAAVTTFYGLDQASGAGGAHPNSDAARASFLAALSSAVVGVEDFEGDDTGSFLGGSRALSFGGSGITGTLQSLGTLSGGIRQTGGGGFGEFAFSGTNWLDVGTRNNSDFFLLTLSSPIRALGFYGSSFSNYASVGSGPFPSIRVSIDDGEAIDVINIPPETVLDESANFFGIISDTPFTTVRMINPIGTVNDGVGLDDIAIAAVPVPATLVLFASGIAGLLGAHAARRTVRKKN